MAGLAWVVGRVPATVVPATVPWTVWTMPVTAGPVLAAGAGGLATVAGALTAGAGALAAGGVLVVAEATVPLVLAWLAGTAGMGLAAGCTAATVPWTTRVAPGTTAPAAEAVADEDDTWGVLAGGGLWAALLGPACPDEPAAAGEATDDTGNEADGTASPAT